MVSSRALGFVLLFLLPLALGIDDDILLKIINKLHQSYGSGNNQYALAINVPARYCERGAKLDQNFLSDDQNKKKVKDDMNGPKRIYKGSQLIAAKPRQIDEIKTCHSEYLLLRSTSPSLMKKLLEKNKDGCTVFFTMNSPCVKTCSTPNKCYSIIPGLEIFRKHRGPKAFVFRDVWRHDTSGYNNVQWEENIKIIDKKIPVYRCFENGCVRCVKHHKKVNQACTE